MNRFFKLYKFLFEDDKYKDIGLNSKVAYCVYRDLIGQNRNVKKDKDGKVYIENPRKYLMSTLNVSINTVTKIHKELNRVGLIKDVWDDVGKPNIVYINYCENPKPQVIHKTYETVKVEEKKEEIKPVEVKKEPIIPKVKEELVGEFTTKDFEEAQKVMERYKVGMIDFEASKVFNRIRCDYFKPEDEKMIKLAIRVLVKHKRDEGRLEVLKNIDTSKVALSLERCKNDIRNNEYVINKLIKYIELKIEYESYWN